MDLEERWQKTLDETRIIRFYHALLSSHEATEIPYIFLAASSINEGDTVMRKGRVMIDKPLIILPQNMPQFSGFELEEIFGLDENSLRLFFMVRGIRFPSLKYQHEIATVDIVEGELKKAIDQKADELERQEDLVTGLIVGSSELWQLSVLLYIIILINRSASSDLGKFLEEHPL